MEKQAYALVKSLKSFRVYVLQYATTAYVPTATVKDVLVQGDSEGRRGKWIAKIQEYELEIKPTKLIKGQGFAKILSESNCQALGINMSMKRGEAQEGTSAHQEIESSTQKTHVKYLLSPWYKDIVEYLLSLRCPPNYDRAKYCTLRLKYQKYVVENG